MSGQVPLVSGEIAEDFANYYVVSEQTPTLLSLGVLVSGEVVLSAGGVLLQPLPGCTDDIISQLELRSPMMADVSRELCHEPMEALMEKWFEGLRPWCLPGRQCATGATARGRVWKRRSSPWAARS